jgi:L-alanine-DL-glutamate epimerase-like enolase superfamily enzyme
VDANQGLDLASYDALLPALCAADVRLLEQPFPRLQEHLLDGLGCSIPIAADESVQTADDLAELEGRVQVINIKLDKCGGLTEGLAMAREARRRGFDVMVGNMVGTVLAMAPAFVLGQLCDIVDLDGPLALAADRQPATEYADGQVNCPVEAWGAP